MNPFWRLSEEILDLTHIHLSDPESTFCCCFQLNQPFLLHTFREYWGFLKLLKQYNAALGCLQNILKLQSANGAPVYSSFLI